MPELRIAGVGATSQATFTYEDCASMPAPAQVEDVAALVPGKAGRAVRLDALLERAGIVADAGGVRHLHVASSDPSFAVSLPIEEARGALVVYALGDGPLPESRGGPFRLLVPGHADECVHVKRVGRLELAAAPGRDTRPKDDAEHERLHRKGKSA